ncbi:hypothetical protein TL16_g03086 [Triparma laevis f. inornata]|uniref:Uncharacterized protein n=1 Tax=Triparma laevis f. inornata TaxID=1714386 RepID=A0A9W7A221_9STRA|nr:hypothetical protein TL16_g03086 [Triparma laevis f. inornata]
MPRLQTVSDASLEDVQLVGDVEVEPDLEDEDLNSGEEGDYEGDNEGDYDSNDDDESDLVMIKTEKSSKLKQQPNSNSNKPSSRTFFAFLFLLLPIIYSIIYERTLAITCAEYEGVYGNASSPFCQTNAKFTEETGQPQQPQQEGIDVGTQVKENILLMISPPPEPNHYQLSHLPRSAPKLLTTLKTFLNLYIRAFSTSLEVLLTLMLPPQVLDELRGTLKAVHIRASEVIIEINDSEAYERSVQVLKSVGSNALILASDAYDVGSKTWVMVVTDPKFIEYRDLAFAVSKELVTVGSRALSTVQHSDIAEDIRTTTKSAAYETCKIGKGVFNDLVFPAAEYTTNKIVTVGSKALSTIQHSDLAEDIRTTTKTAASETCKIGKDVFNDLVFPVAEYTTERVVARVHSVNSVTLAKSKSVAVQFAKQLAVVGMDVGSVAKAEASKAKSGMNDFVKKLHEFEFDFDTDLKPIRVGATKVTREIVNDIFIPAGTYFGEIISNATSKK